MIDYLNAVYLSYHGLFEINCSAVKAWKTNLTSTDGSARSNRAGCTGAGSRDSIVLQSTSRRGRWVATHLTTSSSIFFLDLHEARSDFSLNMRRVSVKSPLVDHSQLSSKISQFLPILSSSRLMNELDILSRAPSLIGLCAK